MKLTKTYLRSRLTDTNLDTCMRIRLEGGTPQEFQLWQQVGDHWNKTGYKVYLQAGGQDEISDPDQNSDEEFDRARHPSIRKI